MKPEIIRYVRNLSLIPHPEGGFFCEVYRSADRIGREFLPERFRGERNICTSIYYLLESEDFSGWHRIKSDETWHFYAGSSITIHMLNTITGYEKMILGSRDMYQYTILNGTWFAVSVNDKDSFALCGCTVSPGFDFEDFELADAKELTALFPEHEEIIKKYIRAKDTF